MKVPFLDLMREYHQIGDELVGTAENVLKNGRFILDKEVTAFEAEFASYVDTTHGIGVNSGTDALYLALRAIGVNGREVILPSHAHISAADAVVRNGGTPVFVDVDSRTYTIDPDEIKKHATENTAAIIPVHLYGHPAEMKPIVEISRDYGIPIVEDASQAHGAKYNKKPVGSFGDVACFSLYPTKNLGAYGDAGIVVTSDDHLAKDLEMLREYGMTSRYRYESIGINSRLDEIQAALLRFKLNRLDGLNEKRRSIAETYNDMLDGVVVPETADNVEPVFHLYVIMSDERKELQSHLDENGVDTLVHYPTPIHQQPSYEGVGVRGELPVTETITDQILSLPMNPWLRPDEVEYVAKTIGGF